MSTTFVQNHIATLNNTPKTRHQATVTTRYVKLDEDTYGWLTVRTENGSRGGICEYTKVTLVKTLDHRVYFKVADGLSELVGKTVSLSEGNADKYLVDRAPSLDTIKIVVTYGRKKEENSPFKGKLLQQWGILDIDSQHLTVTLNSIWDGRFTPIPPGVHRIMAPESSHAKISTEGYRNSFSGKIKANDAWFPIELAGTKGNSSRYVHIGHLSEGCVTVHDIDRWNVVYNFLISHRLPNTKGQYVALLEVRK